jgi:hypothetical protein
VAAAQECDEGEADFVVLADDHALDVGEYAIPGLLDLGHRASLTGSGVRARRRGRDGFRG